MSTHDHLAPRRRMSRRVTRGFRRDTFREVRLAAGFSQGELARSAAVSPSTIHHWEAGTKSPQVDRLAHVARVLGVRIDALVEIPESDRFPGDWRVLAGLTQPELAAAAGVSTTLVARLERAEVTLSDEACRRLAVALGITERQFRDAFERARTRPPGSPV